MLELDNQICHVTFTHTDCKDVWPAYFGETKKYFKIKMPHYVCVNKVIPELPDDVVPIIYDESKPYPQRLHYCLGQLSDFQFIFFDHEDMFLYAEPDYQKLKKYYEIIKSGELDHIRLIKGGLCFSAKMPEAPTLHKFSLWSKWIFSIQPSFWRRTVYMDVLAENLNCNIWELERRSQAAVKKLKLKAAYSQSPGKKKRGWFHFDNSIYPYIATAIEKGKWKTSEYGTELGKVFSEYKIDPQLRGTR